MATQQILSCGPPNMKATDNRRPHSFPAIPCLRMAGNFKIPALLETSGKTEEEEEEEEEMQIRVKCGCGDGSCPEWAIVELQGVVEAQASMVGGIQNLEIGRLCCTSSQGSFTFTVGYHELSGKKMPLKKPLLVLKKKKKVAGEDEEVDSPTAEMEVIGIIRHRILFKTRPKALISKVQIKEKKDV